MIGKREVGVVKYRHPMEAGLRVAGAKTQLCASKRNTSVHYELRNT